jgi:hypothetical protein
VLSDLLSGRIDLRDRIQYVVFLRVLFFVVTVAFLYYRQAPDFLIGPRNKKTTKKKVSRQNSSKLHAGISEETQHTDAGARLGLLRCTPGVSTARNTRLWVWESLPRRLIEFLCGHHHQKFLLVIWNGGRRILMADLFFVVFYWAGQSENPELGARPR